MLNLKSNLSPNLTSKLSAKVCDRFYDRAQARGIFEKKNLKIGVYQALKGELDLSSLISKFKLLRAKIFYPRICEFTAPKSVSESTGSQASKFEPLSPQGLAVRKAEQLEWVKMMDFAESLDNANEDDKWITNKLGIKEPASHLSALQRPDLDWIFVPAVALSPEGNRLGRGGGFYDRYLSQNPCAFRIALGFDMQICPVLDKDPWDEPIDWILTESREWIFDRAKNSQRIRKN